MPLSRAAWCRDPLPRPAHLGRGRRPTASDERLPRQPSRRQRPMLWLPRTPGLATRRSPRTGVHPTPSTTGPNRPRPGSEWGHSGSRTNARSGVPDARRRPVPSGPVKRTLDKSAPTPIGPEFVLGRSFPIANTWTPARAKRPMLHTRLALMVRTVPQSVESALLLQPIPGSLQAPPSVQARVRWQLTAGRLRLPGSDGQ